MNSRSIFTSPFRVYLLMGVLAAIGIYSGFRLPISLFPNSSKPFLSVNIPTAGVDPEGFLHSTGSRIESQIYQIQTKSVAVERITSRYGNEQITYEVEFKWGTDPNEASKELQNVINGFSSQLSQEQREGIQTYHNSENGGFFASVYFSKTRDTQALFKLLDPILSPRLSGVKEAQEAGLWNPSEKEIRIELNPNVLASLQLTPRQVSNAVNRGLEGFGGGSVTQGYSTLRIDVPQEIQTLEDFSKINIPTASGRVVHLSDVARIYIGPKTGGARIIKTNGASSLILFATPKSGGNIKKMSEDFLEVMKEVAPLLPPDVESRVLVDPSEFIRSAINNVFHEVLLAAGIAVVILFLFIGSPRNVITAALEIPLSMVLAFILMKFFNMNLNLISLAGLALSAGMNVDASVVVMENIFRHFDLETGKVQNFSNRLDIIVRAVNEVRVPVLASTFSSLVVFIPLAFTNDLTYAILGDLAKAVVFSHGFSAIVALILVPTIRLQMMSGKKEKNHRAPLDGILVKIESIYLHSLSKLLNNFSLRLFCGVGLVGILGFLLFFVFPRLPREIIGRPDTDWIVLSINSSGNTSIKQMEAESDIHERTLLDEFGDKVAYTFTQIRGPNQSYTMLRLKDKRDMNLMWKALEKKFQNTPTLFYGVGPWNPSEMQIPDPPNLSIKVHGSNRDAQTSLGREIRYLLQESKLFPRYKFDPNIEHEHGIRVEPYGHQLHEIETRNPNLTFADLSDYLRVATEGRTIRSVILQQDKYDLTIGLSGDEFENIEALQALPLGIEQKIIPLKAVASISLQEKIPDVRRVGERSEIHLSGRQDRENLDQAESSERKVRELLENWKKDPKNQVFLEQASFEFEDPKKELNEALYQLTFAVSLSILLIFLTLLIQFGSVVAPLIVLVAVPLGMIGVTVSLYVFKSTLSLNSVLGIILLNGISVANSIILVDFIRNLVSQGVTPKEAALEAARVRLRPILITSLTTIFGMLPVAMGLGEGGRILQPLGITVSGGLWVSTLLTLFVVPVLQVGYLNFRFPVTVKKSEPVFE